MVVTSVRRNSSTSTSAVMESYMLQRWGGTLGCGAVIFGDQRTGALLRLAHDAVFLFFFFSEETQSSAFRISGIASQGERRYLVYPIDGDAHGCKLHSELPAAEGYDRACKQWCHALCICNGGIGQVDG